MKRCFSVLLALLLTISFAGCAGDTASDVSDSVATGQTQEDYRREILLNQLLHLPIAQWRETIQRL